MAHIDNSLKKGDNHQSSNIEVALVGLLVLAGMLRPSLQIITLSGLGVILVSRLWKSGLQQFRTTADLGILLILLTIVINSLIAPGIGETHEQIVRLLIGVSIYYWIVSTLKFPYQIDQSFRLAAGAGIGLGLIALFTVSWPIDKAGVIPELFYRVLQTSVLDRIHPNVMAGTLVLIFPLILAKIVFLNQEQQSTSRVVMYIFAALFVLVVLLLTKSRGAYIALLSSTAVIILLRWKYTKPVSRRSMLVAGLLFSLLIVSAIGTTISSGEIDFRQREEIWSRALAIISDFPLTGTGMGGYDLFVNQYYPFFLNQAESIPHAHNLYLQIAADLGLPGLIAWAAVLLNILVAGIQVFRSSSTLGMIAALGAGLISSQVALMAHGIVDTVTWGMVRPAPLVWAVWGLAIAAQKILIQSSYAGDISAH